MERCPFFSRFMTLFFDKMAGPDFEEGLTGLKEVCENMPAKSSEVTDCRLAATKLYLY